jgi:hypothetical protein
MVWLKSRVGEGGRHVPSSCEARRPVSVLGILVRFTHTQWHMKTWGLQIFELLALGSKPAWADPSSRSMDAPLDLAGKWNGLERDGQPERRGHHPICRCVYRSIILSSPPRRPFPILFQGAVIPDPEMQSLKLLSGLGSWQPTWCGEQLRPGRARALRGESWGDAGRRACQVRNESTMLSLPSDSASVRNGHHENSRQTRPGLTWLAATRIPMALGPGDAAYGMHRPLSVARCRSRTCSHVQQSER